MCRDLKVLRLHFWVWTGVRLRSPDKATLDVRALIEDGSRRIQDYQAVLGSSRVYRFLREQLIGHVGLRWDAKERGASRRATQGLQGCGVGLYTRCVMLM